MQTTARRVAGGVAWAYAGSVLVMFAQIVYTSVTTRVLSPAAFGAYASAQALVALMGYFSLATLGNTLTRMTVMERSTAGTALCLATVAGVGAAAATALLADIWASVWHTPEAAPLIALWAPAVLLSSLAVIPIALLQRRLRYASAAGIQSVAPVLGFVVGGILVFVLRSPSALVIGQLANSATVVGAGLLVVRHEIGLTFSKKAAQNLLSFSGYLSAQNLTHYAFYTLPGLVIARTAGSVALGFFSRANLLVTLPMNFITVGLAKAIYPVMPQVTDTVARRRALSDVVAIGTFLVWPLLGLLAGSSPLAVDILFGPGWQPAAEMVVPVCLFAAGNFVYVILASATESIGWLKLGSMIQGAWAIALALSTLLTWQFDADPRTYLYGYAIAQIAIHILQVRVLSKRGLVPLRIMRHELVGGTMALVVFIVAFGSSQLLDGSSLGVRLVVTGVVTLGTIVAVLVTLPRVDAGRALVRRGLMPRALVRTASGTA